MQWYEISIETTEEAAEAISYYLHEIGAGGVAMEESHLVHRHRRADHGGWYEVPNNGIGLGDVRILAYFYVAKNSAELNQKIKLINQFMTQLAGWGLNKGMATIDSRTVVEEDWAHAWKKYYKPVEISEKLAIKPSWERYKPQEGQSVIELDPGMAFGTGTHATTVLGLQLLEQYIQPGNRVIDVGTGSGVLAIAAAQFGAEQVLAIDLDPVAVSSAEENIRLNGLETQITVAKSDLLALITGKSHESESVASKLNVQPPVELVVANILADVLISFMADVTQVLVSGGIYIASGITQRKESEVAQALKEHGLIEIARLEQEDWVAIAAKKP